jgi:RNA polymerase primary sigma factor
LALLTEDSHEQVQGLITIGKERGYVLIEEVNEAVGAEVHTPEEMEELLSTLERIGIGVFENASMAEAARASAGAMEVAETESKEGPEEAEVDPGSRVLERAEDLVRLYMREMGTVPLLSREGEVILAKRIERGQLRVLKAITRSPMVIQALLGIADDLRTGTRSLKEVVRIDDEESTEDNLKEKMRETLKILEKIGALH